MPSTERETKAAGLLTTQTEKPLHYTYLKEFRVEQCPLFLQHKCTQHKPFTCFYWHFMNQRRRRPVRKRDGVYNYSPDVYCTKYDETTGICPDGDDCLYLHRTAGDTERRYHLRYYKTGICVYDTDSRGYCVKNGPHCAFAHGIHDLRNPVYDIRELQAMESGGGGCVTTLSESVGSANGAEGSLGPNSLDKERNALNEDPRWQDSSYVLANYKTDVCKRPPRLCRQGYACPQYHNNKDKRRTPKKFKYRSTPCPNVKQGDEWGDPSNCESGDNCPYCHTRTEQQFHPEIYKSTKCNDIQQTGYCPRGPFCAFAHVEKEMSAARDLSMESSNDLASLLTNALPHTNHSLNGNGNSNGSGRTSQTGHSSTPIASSLPDHYQSNFEKASHFLNTTQTLMNSQASESHASPGLGPIGSRPRSYSHSASSHYNNNNSLSHNIPMGSGMMSFLSKMGSGEESSLIGGGKGSQRSNSTSFFGGNTSPLFGNMTSNSGAKNRSMYDNPGYSNAADTVESVVGSALDDLSLDDIHNKMEEMVEKERHNKIGDNGDDHSNHILGNSTNLLGSTAPVNIPGARMGGNSRTNASNLSPPYGTSPLSLVGQLGVSPFPRNNSVATGNSTTSSFYDLISGANMSPSASQSHESASNVVQAAVSILEIQRLERELANAKQTLAKMATYEEGFQQAVEVWKREVDDSKSRERMAEQQRDEALKRANSLQKELDKINGRISNYHGLRDLNELESMSIQQLQRLKQVLRSDLDCVDKVYSDKSKQTSA